MAMISLSKCFSQIYTITPILFALLLVEIIALIRSFRRSVSKTKHRLITTTQYFQFIEENNPTISYKKTHSASKDCAVCLSDFEDGEKVRNLKCDHTFHRDCLDKWLQQFLAATCPLCRTRILPDDAVAKYKQQQNLQNLDSDGGEEEMFFLVSLFHGTHVHRFL